MQSISVINVLEVPPGFENDEGLNLDERKVLGKGFPPAIKVALGQFEIINSD